MGDGIMLHRVMSAAPRFTFVPTNPNAAPGFTFINDGHGNWRIKFLTSGTLTFLSSVPKGIDVFLVGGGAGGVSYVGTMVSAAGGGSGRTKTQSGVSVTRGTGYAVTIGSGGANKKYEGTAGSVTGNAGGNTTAFGYTANGGSACKAGYAYYPQTYDYNWSDGGNGGSGGAARGKTGGTNGGNGGSDGQHHVGGTGQGTTTREFGESGGTLYASGGGTNINGGANTGNGGYGGSTGGGGTGIVVIRNHR